MQPAIDLTLDTGILGRAGGVVRPFIVYSLPRSRTAWLASFLSYGGWTCRHEAATGLRSMDEVRRFFAEPQAGTVETAAAQGWRIIHHYVPDIRAVVIRRPVDDVMGSMLAIDLRGEFAYDAPRLRKVMEYGDRMLAQISELPDVLTVPWGDLATEDGCASIFEHCLPFAFDRAWWRTWKDRNVQIDVLAMLRGFHRDRAVIEGFKRACWGELRALRRSGAISGKDTDGLD